MTPTRIVLGRLFVTADRMVVRDTWAELEKQLGLSLSSFSRGKRLDQFKDDTTPGES